MPFTPLNDFLSPRVRALAAYTSDCDGVVGEGSGSKVGSTLAARQPVTAHLQRLVGLAAGATAVGTVELVG